jgi:membrane protease YdiL (CAAX protease family)
MPIELDLPAIILSLLLLIVSIGSIAFWFARWLAPRDLIQDKEPIPFWSIGWINFGIFICALIVGVFVIQTFGIKILTAFEIIKLDHDPEKALTAGIALASILLLQVPVILIIFGLRRYYPLNFAGNFEHKKMPWLKALKNAAPSFLRFLPIIWITSIVWNILLEYLRSMGVVEATPPQELVQLFSLGGNPLLITCLALAAIFLAPYVEEILFRGCIYRFLKSQTLIPFAQFISGVIFAAIHGNLASFGPLIVVGILLAHVYEKEGSLRVSICFHALFNAFSLVLILLASRSEVIPVP